MFNNLLCVVCDNKDYNRLCIPIHAANITKSFETE